MNPHIEMLVRLFVKRDKQERMLTLGHSRNRRADFRHDLLHDKRSLDPAVFLPALANATVDSVARALHSAGAGSHAYCISEIVGADDCELPLNEALVQIVGKSEDSLLFPVGSRVAYYENHEGDVHLLRRR